MPVHTPVTPQLCTHVHACCALALSRGHTCLHACRFPVTPSGNGNMPVAGQVPCRWHGHVSSCMPTTQYVTWVLLFLHPSFPMPPPGDLGTPVHIAAMAQMVATCWPELACL